jgi:hypothetical protein
MNGSELKKSVSGLLGAVIKIPSIPIAKEISIKLILKKMDARTFKPAKTANDSENVSNLDNVFPPAVCFGKAYQVKKGNSIEIF